MHQTIDKMIGTTNLPSDLRIGQVLGDEWVRPNEPRLHLAEKLGIRPID